MIERIFVFVFGSMIGSFLNVCILRMPKDESIVFPASHCTSCNKPIAWYDNIPVLSFLLLRARCRHCKTKISWQYPLIEAAAGILFVVFYNVFGLTPKGILYLYLALVLLAQTLIDFRHRIIPDPLTLPAIVIGLVVSAAFPDVQEYPVFFSGRAGSFAASLTGLLVGGGFLWGVGWLAEKIVKKEAMGGGDVKLLAAIGAAIGWRGVLWTIFTSSLFGSVAGIYGKLRNPGNDGYIPYGPFLAMGAFLYLFIGPQWIEAYFNFLRRG